MLTAAPLLPTGPVSRMESSFVSNAVGHTVAWACTFPLCGASPWTVRQTTSCVACTSEGTTSGISTVATGTSNAFRAIGPLFRKSMTMTTPNCTSYSYRREQRANLFLLVCHKERTRTTCREEATNPNTRALVRHHHHHLLGAAVAIGSCGGPRLRRLS